MLDTPNINHLRRQKQLIIDSHKSQLEDNRRDDLEIISRFTGRMKCKAKKGTK